MKHSLKGLIVGVLVICVTGAGYKYLHRANGVNVADKYRTAKMRRGEITSVVNSTGAVQPIHSVQVGAFVSGPINKVNVDFNDHVTKGQVLAEIDPMTYNAQRNSAQAMLDRANADLMQSEAKCRQSEREWARASSLRKSSAISDADCDTAKANYDAAQANVAICKATIQQNTATLALAQANVDYTIIRSPVDGIITDRKVDSGQTLASQFQTPVLFVVAPDLEKMVNVLASVDEADIGQIRDAQTRGEPVTFRVDAYPNDVFDGKISQVRLTPTTVQNVVTYTVVVEAANGQLKLLPGMTANLSFQIEKHKDAMKIPNAALRFFPKPEMVRKSDRPILDGEPPETEKEETSKDTAVSEEPSGDDSAAKKPAAKPKYVWILDGDLLAAVKVVVGLTDKSDTELVSGDLKDGQVLITGVKTP